MDDNWNSDNDNDKLNSAVFVVVLNDYKNCLKLSDQSKFILEIN